MMMSTQNLIRVQAIENGFLVHFLDLLKVKERVEEAERQQEAERRQREAFGVPGTSPAALGRVHPLLVERTRFCATAEKVAMLVGDLAEESVKLLAYLRDRGFMPDFYTQA